MISCYISLSQIRQSPLVSHAVFIGDYTIGMFLIYIVFSFQEEILCLFIVWMLWSFGNANFGDFSFQVAPLVTLSKSIRDQIRACHYVV